MGVEESDALNLNATGSSSGDRREVVLVACENGEPEAMGNNDHVDVNHVAAPRSPGQRADVVRFVADKGNNLTPT